MHFVLTHRTDGQLDRLDAKRTRKLDSASFSASRVVTFPCRQENAHSLPNCRLQEHCARRSRRPKTMRAPLHAFPGIQLLRDAPRDGAWQRATRAAARNYEVHHRERRKIGARGDQWNVPDRRSESPHPEHISDIDESARKSRSSQHAFLSGTERRIPLICWLEFSKVLPEKSRIQCSVRIAIARQPGPLNL